ncbi:DUF6538 domain-containing protein [Roseivivax marinus]|uniref:DUF6538 domain-containing protein n=1 Tax=Roseivivax marinus TaxID=1379903 RepID=UPI000B8646D5
MSEYKSAPHLFQKDGIFYFVRRVPRDLRGHYSSGKISYSLRTRSQSVARARSASAAMKLDEYWYFLRSQKADIPGKHMLRQGGTRPIEPLPVTTDCMTLSDGVSVYLRLKGTGKVDTFKRAAERCCGYAIDVCGDKPLTDYTKADGNALRDSLIERGLSGSSIARTIGTVRSVFNFAASEAGLSIPNPFAKIYYDRQAGVSDRKPISLANIRTIQTRCYKLDDEARWLVALVADTGMRLAEAAGILREDIIECDEGSLAVQIVPRPWRRLKTKGSERVVPLVGSSLWAAQRILATRKSGEFAFPRYNKGEATNANSASAALNKWIKSTVGETVTMHGFRHAMRDRLRAVECPADIVDHIGGWQTEGVGHSYGTGYNVFVPRKWLQLAMQ